ncbi:hypothetical protein EWM62_11325 [Mucilaginibacter terrigena]|uniref:Nucleotidyl transferase AbiEii/AbiGii toxin family protein n=1 Tax=Mucilaginibacter terrigena TaxID=2492395 RepID=A0A4Q5LKJ5_9SPHI|nr:hypothetical protein [Mucilaginibacter terrigena]RYU90126.1 hypothetical protein EWM62_11325 [Mucilaginibacter terrigena]
MKGNFKDSLLAVCKALDTYNVQYMLVGGTAVALNGYYRLSINTDGEITDKPDIDVWYNPTYENYYNILKVIKNLGEDITEFENEQNPNPKRSFFKYELDDFTLDILPEIKAEIKFADANRSKETIEVEGTQIHFMDYYNLKKDKEATARKKDLEDIHHLKKIRGDE